MICVRGTVTIRKGNIQHMGVQIEGRYITCKMYKPHKECGINIRPDNRVGVSTISRDI